MAALGQKMAVHLPPDRRRRMSTALTFIGRAAAEMDATVRFSHLWIAVEVAAGGFGRVEGMFDRIAADQAPRAKLKEIKDARVELFHQGRRYALSQDQERLMCAAIIAELLSWYGLQDDLMRAAVQELGASGASGIPLGD